jgi:hypothetical protein
MNAGAIFGRGSVTGMSIFETQIRVSAAAGRGSEGRGRVKGRSVDCFSLGPTSTLPDK